MKLTRRNFLSSAVVVATSPYLPRPTQAITNGFPPLEFSQSGTLVYEDQDGILHTSADRLYWAEPNFAVSGEFKLFYSS